MCLAIPMRLLSRRGQTGQMELDGVRQEVVLTLTPDARIGQFLIVHAGYAIEILDEDEAEQTLSLLRELGKSGS